jgi:hypothetical protein
MLRNAFPLIFSSEISFGWAQTEIKLGADQSPAQNLHKDKKNSMTNFFGQ